jgi:hypothetical protein
VNSSSSGVRPSTSLCGTAIRTRKTMEALARNTQYTGESFALLLYLLILPHSTAMTPDQRQMVIDLRDPPAADDSDWEMMDDILQGREALGSLGDVSAFIF